MELSNIFDLPWPPNFFFPGCNCCPECSACPSGFAECWELVVAGVTDATCTECDETFNGTFVLEHSSGCSFGSPQDQSPVCSGTGSTLYVLYTLSYNAGTGLWSIITGYMVAGGVKARWTLDGSLFDCNGPNTLSLAAGADSECNWPGTVTIQPTTCPP